MRTHIDNARTWTNHEVQYLLQERAKPRGQRPTISKIAEQLDRTDDSVRGKFHIINPNRKGALPESEPVKFETIAIPKDDVPLFYELGWRFDGFSAERLCIMTKEIRDHHTSSHDVATSSSSSSATGASQIGACL